MQNNNKNIQLYLFELENGIIIIIIIITSIFKRIFEFFDDSNVNIGKMDVRTFGSNHLDSFFSSNIIALLIRNINYRYCINMNNNNK